MSDRIAIIQAAESIEELRKIKQEAKEILPIIKELKTLTNGLNKSFSSGKPKEYAASLKELKTVTQQYADVEKQLASALERLSRIERNNAIAASENAKARRENAAATREESRARQQLAREARDEAKNINEDTSAHKRLTKETRDAKQKARDYGAEIFFLTKKLKEGSITKQEYRRQLAALSRDFKSSKKDAIELQKELNKLNKSTLPSNQRNGSLWGRTTDVLKAMGIATSIESVVKTFYELGKAFYDTAVKLETLRMSQKVVFKTNEEVAKQNEFLIGIADRYGLELISLTGAYTKFNAAAQGTTLEGEKTKNIFEAVTRSSALLGVTTDDTNGILRALEQMMSKGKIQAEELRGQLGDRMAGAFRLFADGMGVSTAQLDEMLKKGTVITENVLPKFAEQLNKKYELGVGKDIETDQANLARIRNEWVLFVEAVENKTGVVSGGIKMVSNAIVTLLQALKPSTEITAIEQQQQQLNVLGIQLRQNWNDNKKRKEIIEEMISINPLFLNGLDKEKVTLEEISKRIQEVNAQYYQRIILQEQEEKIAELVKDQAENYKDLSKILSDNAIEYSSFSTSVKNALDQFSIGAIKYGNAETTIISSTRAGSEERKRAISILKEMNKIYNSGKLDGFNYVRGIEDGNVAIKAATGEYNNLVNVSNKLLGVQGQLISFNGLLAKSYNKVGDAISNRKKQIEEEIKIAEGRGQKHALVSNVWRSKDASGKWKTTDKKQTDGWYMENGELVLRKPYTPAPEKPKKYTGAKLDGYQKDYLMRLESVRDKELAINEKRFIDGEINEKDYLKKVELINVSFFDKKIAYFKGRNAKELAVEAQAELERSKIIKETRSKFYEIESKEQEENYKLQVNALERQSKELEESDYFSSVERLNRQIDIDNELISKANEYYQRRIESAKNAGKSTLEWERKRDEEIGTIQDARFKRQQSIFEATKNDIEKQTEFNSVFEKRSFEEKKSLILSDKSLYNKEREYRLSLLEIDNQIKINELEIEKLKALKAQYDTKVALASVGGIINPEDVKNSAELAGNILSLENTNIDLNNQAKELIEQQRKSIHDAVSRGFSDLGFNGLADAYSATMERLKGDTASWRDFAILSASAVLDAMSHLSNTQKEKTIANLNEQLKASQETTEQEIGFINQRIEWLNNLDTLSKEQITERSRLEDEARTLKEQQQQREKLIEAQKARAEQRAAAQQALINGLLAATTTLAQLGIPAGLIPAAIAAGLGVANAALIMSKDPVPQYFVGRSNGPAEYAWTQEKGREIITDKNDNIKSLGSDKGPQMTWLEAGDKVLTADRTKEVLKRMGSLPKLGEKVFRKAAMQSLTAPVIVNTKTEDNSTKIAEEVGRQLQKAFAKYDKPQIIKEKGKIKKYSGANLPVIIGEYDLKTGEEIWYQ